MSPSHILQTIMLAVLIGTGAFIATKTIAIGEDIGVMEYRLKVVECRIKNISDKTPYKFCP